MTRRTRESASTATCPICGSKDKPLAQGRFCRHIDSITGECPAAGKTLAEARSLRKEAGDDPVSEPSDTKRAGDRNQKPMQASKEAEDMPERSPVVATDTATNGDAPVTVAAPPKRARKPRSDPAEYGVIASPDLPWRSDDIDKADSEATEQAAKDGRVYYVVQLLQRHARGVTVTRLGRVRKGRI